MWIILIPYLIWIQFDQAPDRGGRPKTWARRSPIWRYFAGSLLLSSQYNAHVRILPMQHRARSRTAPYPAVPLRVPPARHHRDVRSFFVQQGPWAHRQGCIRDLWYRGHRLLRLFPRHHSPSLDTWWVPLSWANQLLITQNPTSSFPFTATFSCGTASLRCQKPHVPISYAAVPVQPSPSSLVERQNRFLPFRARLI